MDRITDAARLACRVATTGDSAEIWRSLKAFAADAGFDHLTVLKAHPELPHRLAPSVVYIDAPHGFAATMVRMWSPSAPRSKFASVKVPLATVAEMAFPPPIATVTTVAAPQVPVRVAIRVPVGETGVRRAATGAGRQTVTRAVAVSPPPSVAMATISSGVTLERLTVA